MAMMVSVVIWQPTGGLMVQATAWWQHHKHCPGIIIIIIIKLPV